MQFWNDDYLDHVASILRKKAELSDTSPHVFLGSSSFRLWDSLAEDLGILNFLNAGIGGGTYETGLQHAPRILQGLKPAGIYVYFGANDVASDGLRPEDVLAQWQRFDAMLSDLCPGSSKTYLSAKFGPARWFWRDEYLAANKLVKEACEASADCHYLDVETILRGANGKPLEKLFEADGIHLNRDGYRVWASAMRPI